MVTLKEIAATSGVSIATVSYVLNGRTDMRITDKTRRRILEAARDLGYRRNALARSVKSGRSDMIAILSSEGAAGYFYPIFHSICTCASENGFGVKTCFFNPETLGQAVEHLLEQRVAGVLFHTANFARCEKAVREFQHCQVPVAAVNCRATLPHCASFASDDFHGAAMATRYLIDCGKKNIACVSFEGNYDYVRLRRSGYESALTQSKPWHITPSNCLNDWASKLFDPSGPAFDGCFCGGDGQALQLYNYMYHHNIRIPDALSIIGFGNLEGSAEAVVPLTTVAQPFTEMGKQASECLIHSIRSGTPTPDKTYEIPTELIVRESVTKTIA